MALSFPSKQTDTSPTNKTKCQQARRLEASTYGSFFSFIIPGTESLLCCVLVHCHVLLSESLIGNAEKHLSPGDEEVGAWLDYAPISCT